MMARAVLLDSPTITLLAPGGRRDHRKQGCTFGPDEGAQAVHAPCQPHQPCTAPTPLLTPHGQ